MIGAGALGNADGLMADEDESDDGGSDDGGFGGDEASTSVSSVLAAADDDGGDDEEGSSHSIGLTMSVGGSAGSGGSGNAVAVSNYPGSRICTFGSGSSGVLARSIGGGGGRAGGGTGNADGSEVTASITVGAKGDDGGSGDKVSVTNAGSIETGAVYKNGRGQTVATGGDAYGILAKSIGAGGGTGGLSDPAASFDQNEEDPADMAGCDEGDDTSESMAVSLAAAEGDDDGLGLLEIRCRDRCRWFRRRRRYGRGGEQRLDLDERHACPRHRSAVDRWWRRHRGLCQFVLRADRRRRIFQPAQPGRSWRYGR